MYHVTTRKKSGEFSKQALTLFIKALDTVAVLHKLIKVSSCDHLNSYYEINVLDSWLSAAGG